jgi:hypothetical protein
MTKKPVAKAPAPVVDKMQVDPTPAPPTAAPTPPTAAPPTPPTPTVHEEITQKNLAKYFPDEAPAPPKKKRTNQQQTRAREEVDHEPHKLEIQQQIDIIKNGMIYIQHFSRGVNSIREVDAKVYNMKTAVFRLYEIGHISETELDTYMDEIKKMEDHVYQR